MFWKALPHAVAAPSHAPVSSQNQPQTAPKLSSVWAERQKRWPPGTWRKQRGELPVMFLQNIQSLSNHSRWRGLQRSHLFDSHVMILILFTHIYFYLLHFFLPRSKVWHTEILFFSPHNYISQLSHQTLHAFGTINEKDREVIINTSYSW